MTTDAVETLHAHLGSGVTTVARCWQIVRPDGEILGFTDHDCDLSFMDTIFLAGSGLNAQMLEQSSGLSIDNSEVTGVLDDTRITESDILSGRFDGAKVTCWLVNWQDVEARKIVFRGSIGEVRRSGGAFNAELRGLTEALNQQKGRVYQKACSAVLGDRDCGFNSLTEGYYADLVNLQGDGQRVFMFPELGGFAEGWFTKGFLEVLDGAAKGLRGVIKSDVFDRDMRVVELWAPLPLKLVEGDRVRLFAGCDKRFHTCRLKFANQLNFRGFPDLPGADWIAVGPWDNGQNNGESLRS